MNKKVISYVLTAAIGVGVGAFGTFGYMDSNKAKEPTAIEQLTNSNILATVWQQQSGEAKALRYQAYNSAMKYVDELTSKPSDKPYAVTLDLDETVVDNSLHPGYVVKHHELFTPDNFKEWTNMAKATAIDGAKEFTDYAKSKGIEVFYVSNRSPEELPATIKNMENLGLVNADKDHVLLKEDTSNKAKRWDSIKEKYNLAIYCGDNLGDFPNGYDKKSNEERRNIVDNNSNDFGTKYIVLPNPTYGDFEGALYGYDFKKSPEQKLQDRLNNIQSFK